MTDHATGDAPETRVRAVVPWAPSPYVSPAEEAAAWAFLDGGHDLDARDNGLGAPETRGFDDETLRILMGDELGAEDALDVSAVFACCRVIAEDVAKMRRRLKRRVLNPATGRWQNVVEYGHPVAELLEHPNSWMTPFEFWEFMVFRAALRGMSAALVVRSPKTGRPVELLPLRSGTVTPEIDGNGWHVGYRVSGYGKQFVSRPGDILVLRGPMIDEVQSFNVSGLARRAIRLAQAIEKSQDRFHASDMRPSSILFVDLGITSNAAANKEVLDRIKAEWKDTYGPGGRGGMAVVDKKFDLKTIAVDGVNAQVIENRKFQIEEICRFFRVYPQKIMHQPKSGSVEQDNASHVSDTLHPWTERCEQSMKRDLIDRHDPEDAGLYIHFDMMALARGTPQDRMRVNESKLKSGWTPNEIRESEDEDPLPYPEMDRPQLLANNTGLAPTPLGAAPAPEPAALPPARAPLPKPAGAEPAAPASALPSPRRPALPKPATRRLRDVFARLVRT